MKEANCEGPLEFLLLLQIKHKFTKISVVLIHFFTTTWNVQMHHHRLFAFIQLTFIAASRHFGQKQALFPREAQTCRFENFSSEWLHRAGVHRELFWRAVKLTHFLQGPSTLFCNASLCVCVSGSSGARAWLLPWVYASWVPLICVVRSA